MQTFLDYIFWGNAVKTWLLAVGVIVVAFIVIRIFKSLVFKRLQAMAERSANNIDDVLVTLLGKVGVPFLYVLAVYFGAQVLEMTPKIERIIGNAMMVVITWSVLRLITSLIALSFRRYMHRQPGETREKQARGIMVIINIVIWVVGFVFLIDNFGYNITTIITGWA